MQSSNLKIAYGHAIAIKSGITIIIISWHRHHLHEVHGSWTFASCLFLRFASFCFFLFFFSYDFCVFLFFFFRVAKCWVRDRFVIINMIDEPTTPRQSPIATASLPFQKFKRWLSGNQKKVASIVGGKVSRWVCQFGLWSSVGKVGKVHKFQC